MFLSEKQICRQQASVIRDSLPKSVKEAADHAVYETLLHAACYADADVLLSYYSFRSEIDTKAIILHAMKHNKTVALPRCCGRHMEFYRVESLDDLVPGALGIPEPQADPSARIEPTDQTLCLVPGLAFDRKGTRLGYGGGFYDRYLKQHPVATVGLTIEQLLFAALPHTFNDVPVDMIITEQHFYRIRN